MFSGLVQLVEKNCDKEAPTSFPACNAEQKNVRVIKQGNSWLSCHCRRLAYCACLPFLCCAAVVVRSPGLARGECDIIHHAFELDCALKPEPAGQATDVLFWNFKPSNWPKKNQPHPLAYNSTSTSLYRTTVLVEITYR